MHVPPLFQVVDLQIQVNNGSLKAESDPIHPVHIVASVQEEQLVLQAKLFDKFYKIYK